jgi:uncharacterized membrane protein YccC
MHPQLRAALHLDRDQLDVAAGLRLAVSVAAPVALGVGSGHDVDGMVAGLGALNVATAEGVGNYSTRALTLGCVLIGNAVGVGAGSAAAMVGWIAVPIMFAGVLIAAYAGVIGPVAERTGWFGALMFMIGLGLPDPSLAHAIHYAGLVAGGGLWATAVIVVLWPLHPHRPVFRSVGRSLRAVGDLLELVGRWAPAGERDRAIARAHTVGHETRAMTRWRTVHDGHRDAVRQLRELATTAERACADAVVLDRRLREAEARALDVGAGQIVVMREAALRLGRGLAAVGGVLRRGRQPRREPGVVWARQTAKEVTRALRRSAVGEPALSDLCAVLARLAEPEDMRRGNDRPAAAARVRAGVGWRGVLRANLTLSSFWCRYAVRFAIAAATGLAIAHALRLPHGYWVLITIAVVVKPQLSVSTTSTIHRVAGTVFGALLGVGLVITVTGAWGLVVTLAVLAVVAASLIRVNYGLAVVFITPLVLVLLNVPHPGQWQIADTRVINTLLGAAIGLLATMTVLPGSERGAVVERSQVALDRIAAFLHAIAHDSATERLTARHAARTGTDDLLAVIERAIGEPIPLAGPDLYAVTGMAAAAEDMWERAAELELAVPVERVTPELRRSMDAAADRLEQAVTLMGRPGLRAAIEPLNGALRAVQTAATRLSRATLG